VKKDRRTGSRKTGLTNGERREENLEASLA